MTEGYGDNEGEFRCPECKSENCYPVGRLDAGWCVEPVRCLDCGYIGRPGEFEQKEVETMITLIDKSMEQDEQLLTWLGHRFNHDDKCTVIYGTKNQATVPDNNLVVTQEYIGERLVRVDWCSPHGDVPGRFIVTVEKGVDHVD